MDDPTPIPRPDHWKSHEAEDLEHSLGLHIFSDSKDPEEWTEGSLHDSNHIAKSLGKKLPDNMTDVSNEKGIMTLKGRQQTFSEDWSEWLSLDMAECGLYVTPNGKVKCFVCKVMFREVKFAESGHLQRHKELAPFCQQLKRCGCDGTKPTPPGKRVRTNSTSAYEDLKTSHI